MTWYVKHIGEEYIPRVYSAAAFRKRFDDLYACMMEMKEGPERRTAERPKEQKKTRKYFKDGTYEVKWVDA